MKEAFGGRLPRFAQHLEVEKDPSPVALPSAFDGKLVQGNRFDVGARRVALAIEWLAVGDAANLSCSPRVRLGQGQDFNSSEDDLIGVRDSEDFGEPSVEQGFKLGSSCQHLTSGALLNFIGRTGERAQSQSRILKQLLEAAPIGEKANVGRMLDNLKSFHFRRLRNRGSRPMDGIDPVLLTIYATVREPRARLIAAEVPRSRTPLLRVLK